MDTITIKGVNYVGFSVERADMGGRYSKKDTIAWLKEQGIKYNLSQAYTIYVGHWAILIEKKYEDKVSKFLFGA